MALKDLCGERFGNLVVIRSAGSRNGLRYWVCQCDCGNEKIVRGGHLQAGNVSSCGCKRGNKKHGEYKTRLYHIWVGMRARCRNPKDQQYDLYGGRGIAVCAEWNDYETFRQWAMSSGYAEHLTIDRINNDDGYNPQNCRWATPREQANNTRKTRLITYNGETHSVSEWARKLGMTQGTLSSRLNKCGWSAEDALRKEVKKYGS